MQPITTTQHVLRVLLILGCLRQALGLSLSPVETVLFGSRLSSIQQDMESKLSQIPEIMPTDEGCDVVLIFPGAGGEDDLTRELQEKIQQCDKDVGIQGRWIVTIDWKELRGSVVTAAFDGQAVGEAVAKAIMAKAPPRSVHVIGISVGAFCAHSVTETLSSSHYSNKKPHVRLTLLDPFCSRGLWGAGYGARNFGVGADFAEHYLNTDDPVPTTNDPLPNLFCVDVTGSTERESFQLPSPDETMHCWPVAYYARYGYKSVKDNQKRIMLPTHDKSNERGRVLKLQ